MISNFEFATAGRIVFGAGRLKDLGSIAGEIRRRILLVVGSRPERADGVRKYLAASGCQVSIATVEKEPTLELAEALGQEAGKSKAELVVGFGGGSVIDAAKAAAAMATNEGPVLRYLEVIGEGKSLAERPLPVIAIPTTAGTGAEVTRNAVLHDPKTRLKVSLRSPLLLPRVALVDPETTLTLPPEVTAATGMDALTQLIESFLSCRATALTDAFCREAIPKIAGSLERSFRDGTDLVARTDVAFASLCSGLALANSGLGAVHGLAAPLGGAFAAPHGAVCAALLVPVLRVNLAAAQASVTNQRTVDRFRELAGILIGAEVPEPTAAIEWLAKLTAALAIPGLAAYGLQPEHFADIAHQGLAASSMKGNPVPLSQQVLEAVLGAAL